MGASIRAIRKSRKLSQLELALSAGVTQATISRLERGDRNVSVHLLSTIAISLGVELIDLFEDTRDEDQVRLLETYKRLSAVDRKAILRHSLALSQMMEIARIVK
jgi:transcriptional regulator with XRE-family HTH domain